MKNQRCQGKAGSFVWDFKQCTYHKNCNEQHHALNNAEIHFTKIKSNTTTKIATNLILCMFKQFRRDSKLFYFLINYIELDKMGMDIFGYQNRVENIYNRFFRANLLYGVKRFFGDKPNKVTIKTIYHDKSDSKESHQYFPWHAGHKINSEKLKKVSIENEDIIFVNSDHKHYFEHKKDLVDESNLIQLIDLILGAVKQNIYNSSKNSYKKEIAMQIRHILKNLLELQYDGYWKEYKNHVEISFFPKEEINDYEKTFKDTKRIHYGYYYRHKRLKIPEYALKQIKLDFFKKNNLKGGGCVRDKSNTSIIQ